MWYTGVNVEAVGVEFLSRGRVGGSKVIYDYLCRRLLHLFVRAGADIYFRENHVWMASMGMEITFDVFCSKATC